MGVTLEELLYGSPPEDGISSWEFDLWILENMCRSDECPHCGVDPKDLMDFEVRDIKCPICKSKYGKVMPMKEEET